jgi:transcriptional regulator with XRE-family HTH domain
VYRLVVLTHTAKFGDLFRQERKRSGKSLGEVAQFLRISVTYLSDVERCARPPLKLERIREAGAFMCLNYDRLLALMTAAANHQGAFELPLPASEKGREAGAALMRGWDELDDDAFDQIVMLMAGRKEKDP